MYQWKLRGKCITLNCGRPGGPRPGTKRAAAADSGEEVFNAVSHGAGGLLAVAATVLLLLRSHTGMKVLATCFYGISMTVMMFMSGVYHAMPTGSTAKPGAAAL